MQRFIVCLLLFAQIAAFGFSVETTDPVPYAPDEFPVWSHSLRRAEIIAIGLFPFIFFFTSLAYDSIQFIGSGGDSAYAPGPFRSPDAQPLSNSEKAGVILVSISLSSVLAAVDYFIGKNEAKKK